MVSLLTGSVGCSLLFSEEGAASLDAGPNDTDAMDAGTSLPAIACGSIEILAGEFSIGVDLSSLWDIRASGGANDNATMVTPVSDGIEFTLGPEGNRAGLTSTHSFSLENSTIEVDFGKLATEARTNLSFTARNVPNSDKSFSVSFENETVPKVTVYDGVSSSTEELLGPPTRWEISHLEDDKVSLELFGGNGDLLFTQRISPQVPIDSLRLGVTVTPFSSTSQPTVPTTTKLNRITAPLRVSQADFCPLSEVNDTFEGVALSSIWAHHVPATIKTPCRNVNEGVLNSHSEFEKKCIVASSKGFLFDTEDSIEVEIRAGDSTLSGLHLILDDEYSEQLAIVFDSATNTLSLLNSVTTELVSQTPSTNGTPIFLRLSRSASEVLFQWSEDRVVWQMASSILSADVPIGPYKIILVSTTNSTVAGGDSIFDNLIGTKGN